MEKDLEDEKPYLHLLMHLVELAILAILRPLGSFQLLTIVTKAYARHKPQAPTLLKVKKD